MTEKAVIGRVHQTETPVAIKRIVGTALTRTLMRRNEPVLVRRIGEHYRKAKSEDIIDIRSSSDKGYPF